MQANFAHIVVTKSQPANYLLTKAKYVLAWLLVLYCITFGLRSNSDLAVYPIQIASQFFAKDEQCIRRDCDVFTEQRI